MSPITQTWPHEGASLEDALDFLNTDELDGSGRPVEHFPTLRAATEWLEERGLLDPTRRQSLDAPASRRAARLEHVLEVRSGLREIVEALVAGRPVADGALAVINGVLLARSTAELVRVEQGIGLRHRPAGDPIESALAALVEPVVGTIATGDADRLRICGNDGCRWVFEDTSRTGRRRWCSMSSCGNRAKAARHRARKRAALQGTGSADATP
jgi:predicted RNA-binding Zn ribbon-like protein